MRLADGKTLTELKGGHLGDQARYNHRIARAIWSADERWVAALYAANGTPRQRSSSGSAPAALHSRSI